MKEWVCSLLMLERLAEHFERLRPMTLREPVEGGFIKYPYGVPAGFYDQLWDWDGFFICRHLADRPDDPKPEYFRYWVLNFLSAYREVGYPPGCVTNDQPETERRGFSLKPFMGQAALHGSSEGFEWLRECFAEVVEIVTRREGTNRDEETGLYFWDDAMQSGADNNAADSNLPELKGLFLSCDLNAFQHLEYDALAQIARELGEDDTVFVAEAAGIKEAMNEHLWNESLGSYDNRRRDTVAFVNCVSYSNFVPLWAGMVPEERAKGMLEKFLLSEEHLMTHWGARSLSKQDRSYNNVNIIIPYSNWCGPIWPIANYFYFCALKNYGFDSEARELAEKLATLVLSDLDEIGTMHENYCAETGRSLAPSIDQAPRFVEGGFIGWNLLVQDLLERASS